MSDPQPGQKIYDLSKPYGAVIRAAPYVGAASLILSLVIVVVARWLKCTTALHVLLACWAILPPLWFVFEFFIVYPRCGRPNTFEPFKHGQQLCAALWAGVLAVLITVGASGGFKPEPPTIVLCPHTNYANPVMLRSQ